MQGAKLQGANLQGINLQGADLHKTDLQGADLMLALFGSADGNQQDVRTCENLLPEQMKGTFYPQESPLPILPDAWEGKAWPEDCKPQVISLSEWKQKRDKWARRAWKPVIPTDVGNDTSYGEKGNCPGSEFEMILAHRMDDIMDDIWGKVKA